MSKHDLELLVEFCFDMFDAAMVEGIDQSKIDRCFANYCSACHALAQASR